MKDYRIGIVNGYIYNQEFDSANYLNKIKLPLDENILKMLVLNRLDLGLVDEFNAKHLFKSMPEAKTSLKVISPPLEIKTLHVMFSEQNKDAASMIKKFDEALATLTSTGLIEKILSKHDL